MINSIKIDYFRGIRDLTVEHLSKVNLIVGDNNCGKTSLMEALQLFRSTQGLANIYKVARTRESIAIYNANSIYDNIMFMFPKDTDESIIKLSCEFDANVISLYITGKESKELIDMHEINQSAVNEYTDANGETETDVFEGKFAYIINGVSNNETFRLNRLSKITGTKLNQEYIMKISYVSPFEHLKGNIVNKIIKDDNYKGICLTALQLFDSEIEDIIIFKSDFVNRPVEYLKHKELGNMPLSTYGDGIKKVLVIANAIAEASDGILLIDEIETAIHKKYYHDVFNFIVKACIAFNVQLFVTTHSAEAIDGILSTQNYNEQNSEDNITVVTLKRENNRTYSRVLSGREVYKNREDFGFEVRL